jgi:hypothetical protein
MLDVNNIDWNEAWKKPEGEEAKNQGFVSCGRRWMDPERCRRYNNMMKEGDWASAKGRIESMDINKDSRILDIGAGPGTLSIPLSRLVSHVTAVEPSEGMRICLNENIREEGIKNIDVIPKNWEDVDINGDLNIPYDIVVASYSLGFPDLREGLRKMDQASAKYVYIFWFADMISPWQKQYGEIWEKLYGVPRKPGNKPNIIYNLLQQMGIYANVEVTEEESVHKFNSIEEAVTDQKEGLNLTTAEQERILRDYLLTKLVPEDGKFIMKNDSFRAKIWWRTLRRS